MITPLGRIFLSALFLAIAVLLFVLTLSLGPTARLVPVAVVVPTIILLLLQLCFDLFPQFSETVDSYLHLRLHGVEKLRAQGSITKSQNNQALGSVLVWFGAAPLLIYLFGFMLATPLYTIIFLRFHAREGWTTSLAIGTAISAVISLLLVLAVGEPVFDGWLIEQVVGGMT